MANPCILAINPGTTTTRCALFTDVGNGSVVVRAEQNIDHDEIQMAAFVSISDQLGYRTACVQDFLDQHLGDDHLIACGGRGGMLTPVPAGVIAVNDDLIDFALNRPVYRHASNLGAPLANGIATRLGIPAFIVDPVSVDELADVARVSGFDEIPRMR